MTSKKIRRTKKVSINRSRRMGGASANADSAVMSPMHASDPTVDFLTLVIDDYKYHYSKSQSSKKRQFDSLETLKMLFEHHMPKPPKPRVFIKIEHGYQVLADLIDKKFSEQSRDIAEMFSKNTETSIAEMLKRAKAQSKKAITLKWEGQTFLGDGSRKSATVANHLKRFEEDAMRLTEGAYSKLASETAYCLRDLPYHKCEFVTSGTESWRRLTKTATHLIHGDMLEHLLRAGHGDTFQRVFDHSLAASTDYEVYSSDGTAPIRLEGDEALIEANDGTPKWASGRKNQSTVVEQKADLEHLSRVTGIDLPSPIAGSVPFLMDGRIQTVPYTQGGKKMAHLHPAGGSEHGVTLRRAAAQASYINMEAPNQEMEICSLLVIMFAHKSNGTVTTTHSNSIDSRGPCTRIQMAFAAFLSICDKEYFETRVRIVLRAVLQKARKLLEKEKIFLEKVAEKIKTRKNAKLALGSKPKSSGEDDDDDDDDDDDVVEDEDDDDEDDDEDEDFVNGSGGGGYITEDPIKNLVAFVKNNFPTNEATFIDEMTGSISTLMFQILEDRKSSEFDARLALTHDEVQAKMEANMAASMSSFSGGGTYNSLDDEKHHIKLKKILDTFRIVFGYNSSANYLELLSKVIELFETCMYNECLKNIYLEYHNVRLNNTIEGETFNMDNPEPVEGGGGGKKSTSSKAAAPKKSLAPSKKVLTKTPHKRDTGILFDALQEANDAFKDEVLKGVVTLEDFTTTRNIGHTRDVLCRELTLACVKELELRGRETGADRQMSAEEEIKFIRQHMSKTMDLEFRKRLYANANVLPKFNPNHLLAREICSFKTSRTKSSQINLFTYFDTRTKDFYLHKVSLKINEIKAFLSRKHPNSPNITKCLAFINYWETQSLKQAYHVKLSVLSNYAMAGIPTPRHEWHTISNEEYNFHNLKIVIPLMEPETFQEYKRVLDIELDKNDRKLTFARHISLLHIAMALTNSENGDDILKGYIPSFFGVKQFNGSNMPSIKGELNKILQDPDHAFSDEFRSKFFNRGYEFKPKNEVIAAIKKLDLSKV